MTTPQAVTERYVSNLISNGRNREFDIDTIIKETTTVNEQVVGIYFKVIVAHNSPIPSDKTIGVGATISAAIRHALTEHGVTFR